MTLEDNIQTFLAGKRFAVVGASTDGEKYGNKVLRAYLQNGLDVIPVNPKAQEVEGVAAVANLDAIAEAVDGLSIITPPNVTEKFVEQAVQLGIKNIWLQPGAESDRAVEIAEQSGANVIHGGPCLLVSLHFRDV
jgi:predicted CoA-binding protein